MDSGDTRMNAIHALPEPFPVHLDRFAHAVDSAKFDLRGINDAVELDKPFGLDLRRLRRGGILGKTIPEPQAGDGVNRLRVAPVYDEPFFLLIP